MWLAAVGARGWMVISRDKGILHKPREKRAVKQHSVGCFIIGEKRDLSKFNLLRVVVLNLPQMERRFAEEERPFIYLIDQNGVFRPVAL